ncbi:MAG: hypothetical protein Q9165_008394 [Trypethelium subeluteriae]
MKDYQKEKVLHHMAWFRVILDEAHWVRNQETVQFRAVNALYADRRWCLTGTPLHNKLEDWGALVRFLKIDPFHGKSAKATFSRYIIDPLFSNDYDPYRNFRKVLRLICLRRKEQDQSRLVAHYETARVELRPDERALYEKAIEQAQTDADLIASSNILGRMLSLHAINFVRIDGNVTFSERQRQLEAFRERPEVSTLLMTFSTGAVG